MNRFHNNIKYNFFREPGDKMSLIEWVHLSGVVVLSVALFCALSGS